jgi:uncharacterized 2Fe-2S/4Fe-4S cluster protein (DUF4445 family)
MKLTINRGAKRISAEAAAGEKLIEALDRAGASVSAPCGGRCFCGKCVVQVKGDVTAICDAERRFLTDAQLAAGYRLACGCSVAGDVEVTIEEGAARVLVDGANGELTLDPAYRIDEARCEKPSLTAQKSDAARLCEALGISEDDIANGAYPQLAEALRGGGVTYAARFFSKVMAVTAEKPRVFGCAVDIGTTTMAAYLVNLATGELVRTASMLNPQRAYGGDVITRANHTMEHAEGLNTLARLVRGGICDLIEEMRGGAGIEDAEIRHVALVGNTIMMHLVAELSVKYIATLPFVPVYAATRHVPAEALGLPYKNAVVTLGPCVAGYVGADTVAAVVACGLDAPGEAALMIDIGTNGEIALRVGDKMWCCSAAAGPAFEGAHIRCGSGAVEGAIDRVKIEDGKPLVTTIGGKKALSICGSGIVDAVAEMLREEIIDETGRMDGDLILADGVFICQKDVREVQLAKAAIAAGIGVLADAAGIEIGEIKKLYLAGGFGNFIDRKSACAIGLLPPALEGRIEPVGNAAGTGARMMIADQNALRRAEEVRRRMTYIELSASADFQERFADNMLFE